MLVSASDDKSLVVWDVAVPCDAVVVANLSGRHHAPILQLSCSGRVLASRDEQGRCLLWSTETWSCLNVLLDEQICRSVSLGVRSVFCFSFFFFFFFFAGQC